MIQRVSFPFEKRPSPLFDSVYRPAVLVSFWSRKITCWVDVVALVDTGADYTLLPYTYANALGIDVMREGQGFATQGIGGSERVHLVRRWKFKLGQWMREIPLGFIHRDDVPPLLGRQGCLEAFKLTLFRRRTSFSLR